MVDSGESVSRAPARWLVLEVPRPADEVSAGLFIDILTALSGRGVEERDGMFLAYIDGVADDVDGFVARLQGRLDEVGKDGPVRLGHRWQLHDDWLEFWRRGLGPRRITDRLVVSPTWEHPCPRPGDLLISLDPGMAFGSGEHATTRICMRLLDEVVRPGQRIVDVGAGSGILSISAALMGAGHVLALEVDGWACAVAEENAARNGVTERVAVVNASVGPEFLAGEEPFDGLVANIETGVLIPRICGFRGGIRSHGWMILGGVLETESERVLEVAGAAGFRSESTDIEDGWWGAAFRA